MKKEMEGLGWIFVNKKKILRSRVKFHPSVQCLSILITNKTLPLDSPDFSSASFLCHKNQSVVGEKENLKDKEELEEDQEEEGVLSQGQEEVEDLEEVSDDGNEEEIVDNQQRVLSEALAELGVDCDEFEDNRQENNVSLYLFPVEDSIGSKDELSNMHFDGAFNVQKIQKVNQDTHFIRDCKELIEGLWKVFVFFSYSNNSKTKRVQQLRI